MEWAGAWGLHFETCVCDLGVEQGAAFGLTISAEAAKTQSPPPLPGRSLSASASPEQDDPGL